MYLFFKISCNSFFWKKKSQIFVCLRLFLRVKFLRFWCLHKYLMNIFLQIIWSVLELHNWFTFFSILFVCLAESFYSSIMDHQLLHQISVQANLILASTNPQCNKRSFIKLPVQCMKITSSKHYTNCFLIWHSEQFMLTKCSELVIFMYLTGNSILLSYFGLVDARIRAWEETRK